MMGCWINFGLRLALLPAFAVKAVLQLPYSYTREEPSRSGAWGAGASLAAASGSGGQAASGKAQAASAAGLPGTSQPLAATLIGKPEWQLVLRRIKDMRDSLLLLLYTAVPYNLLVSGVKLLGAGVFLTWLEPYIQRFLAIFIGKYKLEKPSGDGQAEVLYSFANSVDTSFALPAGYAAFPFTTGVPTSGSVLKAAKLAEAKRAHLCGMAAKLAYENPLTIADAVTRWGFTFLTDQKADHASSTVPQTYWYAFYNADAVIICFRGTSPLNLLNWQTDIDLGMSNRAGYGRVHDGFFNALFDKAQHKRSLRDGFSTNPETVFGAAFSAVTEAHVVQKPIYICGHSLGGVLSSVFAMALAVVNPGMTARIGGVLTYGQPRVGDDEYASIFDDRFHRITLRHVHASDIVPRVPTGLGYVHHGVLRFIPSFDVSDTGRVLTNSDQIDEWQDHETRLGVALWYSARKLFWSQWPPRESVLHTLTRLFMLPLPGLLVRPEILLATNLSNAWAPCFRGCRAEILTHGGLITGLVVPKFTFQEVAGGVDMHWSIMQDHFPGDYENLLRQDVARREAAAAAA